jgi:hypothetical protein
MPILFFIQSISGNYPDIAKNLEKSYFKIMNCYFSAFFTLWASRSRSTGIVAARVRLGRFAVVHSPPDLPSFMSRCLVQPYMSGWGMSASTRE